MLKSLHSTLRVQVPALRRQPRGTALIVSMALIMLLSGLAMVLMNEMRTRAQRTEVDAEDIKSFEAAEAGLDAAIRSINTGGTGCLGVGWIDANNDKIPVLAEIATGGWTGGVNVSGAFPYDGIVYSASGFVPPKMRAIADMFFEKGAPLVPKPMPRPQACEFDFYRHSVTFGDVRYFTWTVNWYTDGLDNDGANGADDDGEHHWFTVYSTGFSNPTTPEGKYTTVEAVLQRMQFQAGFQVDAALEFQIAPYQPAP